MYRIPFLTIFMVLFMTVACSTINDGGVQKKFIGKWIYSTAVSRNNEPLDKDSLQRNKEMNAGTIIEFFDDNTFIVQKQQKMISQCKYTIIGPHTLSVEVVKSSSQNIKPGIGYKIDITVSDDKLYITLNGFTTEYARL